MYNVPAASTNKESGTASNHKSWSDKLTDQMIENIKYANGHNDEVDDERFKRSLQAKPYSGKGEAPKSPQPPEVGKSPFGD